MGKFESQTDAVMAWMEDLKQAGVDDLSPLGDDDFVASMAGILTSLDEVTSAVPKPDNVISLSHERFKRHQRKQAREALVSHLNGEQLGQQCQALYERQQQWVARLMNAPLYQDFRSQKALQQVLQINTQLFTGAIHAGTLSPWQTEVLLFRKNMIALQFDLPAEFQRVDGTCWSIMTINRTLYNTMLGMPTTQAATPELNQMNNMSPQSSAQQTALMQQAWSNAYLQQMLGLKQGLEVMLVQEDAAFDKAVLTLQSVVSPPRSLWQRVSDALSAFRS